MNGISDLINETLKGYLVPLIIRGHNEQSVTRRSPPPELIFAGILILDC